MIDLNKVVALWYMHVSDTSNYMAAISRTDEGKPLLQWRMRYFEKGSPPDSKDKRNWYEGIIDDSETEAIEKLRLMSRILTQHGEGPMYEVLRGNKSDQQFFEEFRSMPWAHVSTVEVEKKPA